jgi:hypothetical protein
VAAAIQEKKKKSKKLFISLFFLLSRSFAWLSIKHAHKTHDTCFLFKLVREFLILFFHFMKQFLKNFDLFVLCFFLCAVCPTKSNRTPNWCKSQISFYLKFISMTILTFFEKTIIRFFIKTLEIVERWWWRIIERVLRLNARQGPRCQSAYNNNNNKQKNRWNFYIN